MSSMWLVRKFSPDLFKTRWALRCCIRHVAQITFLVALQCAAIWAQTELIAPTVRTTFNAGQSVETVALSPDGKWGAVGTRSGGVGIFALEASSQPRWVAHHKKRVNVIAFNRAGSLLASAGDDGLIDLVNVPSAQVRELNGHRHKVWALAFSPEGQFLASGGDDKEIIVWDSSSGTELYRLGRDSGKAVIFLGFNGMGTTLLAVDESGVISEWDVKNRSRLRQLKDSDKTIDSAAGSFSGTFLAVGTEFSALQKGTNAAPGASAQSGKSDNSDSNARETLRDNPLTINPSSTIRPTDLYRESRIKLYDTEKLEVAKTIDGINGEVSSISVSADNHYVAVVRQRISESYLSIYDILRGIEVTSFPGKGNVKAVAFSPDGQSLASGADNGEVRVYAIKGIQPGGEVGDLTGMKFKVTTSQPNSLIPANSNLIVGVMDLDANGVDSGTGRAVADLLRTRIAGSGSATLVERAKMEQIIREQRFQYSNRADPASAVKLGHLLGAGKMIFGSVSKLGTSMTIHTEVVDVETGRIEGSCEVICQQCAGEDLPEAVSRLKRYLVADSR
jgi:WD40 repeat protein